MENELPEKKKLTIKESVSSLFRTPLRKVVAVLALVVVLIVIAVLVGYMAVLFKLPSQKAIVVGNVCNAQVVNSFNSTMESYYGDGSTREAILALEGMVKDISKKAGYENDATCVFIKYRVAIVQQDYKVASETAKKLQDLAGNGQFVDMNAEGINTVKSMLQAAERLAPKGEEVDFGEEK